MHHPDRRLLTAHSSEDSAVERFRTTSDPCLLTSAGFSTSAEIPTALADPDYRITLEACAEQSCSVSDIIKTDGILRSIFYRSVNRLLDIGLIHERTTIQADSRNECESIPGIYSMYASLTDSGPSESSLTISQSTGPHRSRAFTDGGEIDSDTDDKSDSKELGTIFVEITGTEKLVDEQELARPSRDISHEGKENTLSEYVSTISKNDGLADSLPDGQQQE
jgi:hypothetical protein